MMDFKMEVGNSQVSHFTLKPDLIQWRPKEKSHKFFQLVRRSKSLLVNKSL